jgi:tetratricopeptide (TPR) repeat protein
MVAARPGAADRLQAATVVQLGAGPLVGREDVMRDLLAAANEAVQQMPAVATVVAEPGHGKTHLAATLVEKLRVHAPAAEVLDLRAREPVPGDADETLRALLTRALETASGAGEASIRARFTAVVGAELAAALWPAVALTLRLISPDATQVRSLAAAPGVLRSMAMRAAGEALRARARRRPICVVLDDAQFADDTALDALEYAALAEAKAPVFVCALGRPSFAEARKSFGERAARQVVHHLGPLETARAAELCRRLLAPAENVPQGAIDILVRRTQGIPLLLVELVRGLKRDGLVRKRMRGDTWFLATDELERVPDSPLVEWLAQRELVSLSDDLASHARLAALLGLEFGADEMAGVVAELDAQDAGGDFPLDAHVATRRLAGLGLLMTTRTGGFRFRHALVRDAVARSVAAPLRERVHKAAARFYATTRAIPDVRRLPLLARHSAEAGLRREAARLYLELANEARSRHLYLDAERSYTCALDALDAAETADRLAALHGRGSTRYRLGRYEDALADLTDARALAQQLGDRPLQAEILLDASTALDWTTDFVRSSELVDEAELLAAGESATALRAKLVLCKGRALFRRGRRAEASVALEEAVALAERSGDETYETLIIALVLLVLLLPDLGRLDDAEKASSRAIALANERGDRLHLGAALNNRRNMRIARKDVSGACEDLTAFMQIGREMGFVTAEYFAEFNLSEVLYQAGQIDAALEHGRRAARIEERHPEVASQGPLAMLLLARIDAYRGREAEARETLQAIGRVLERERRERRESGALSTPNEKVLLELVDLCTRDATKAEWEALLRRSASDSVEQEPIEVADLYGTWALRRGNVEEARNAFEEAARRAARIPNVMDGRVERGLFATRAPAT